MTQYDVFISYSRVDGDVARYISHELEGTGVSCFLDFSSIVDENFADAIQSAVINCKYVIFIYGAQTENSVRQRRELDLALDRNKKVITLLTDTEQEGVIRSILKSRTICHTSIAGVYDEIWKESRKEDEDDADVEHTIKHERRPMTFLNSFKKKRGLGFLFGVLFIAIVLVFLLTPLFITSSPPDVSAPVSSSPMETPDDSFEVDKYPAAYPSYLWIWLSVATISSGIILIFAVMATRRKKNVKITCDVDARISIDGQQVAEINAGEVYATYLRKGEYFIDFRSGKDEHNRIVHKITDNGPRVVFAEFLDNQEIKFKCFIAGSLSLNTERNALIATVSKMYNKWESEHFRISAYTFEDFNRDVVPGGQQNLYNTFIETEANWCIFIITDGIGEKTLDEYKVAMESLQKHGHPKILFLASPSSSYDETLTAIKKEIIAANQYWNTCNNLEHMQSIFRECVEWDITLLDKSRR